MWLTNIFRYYVCCCCVVLFAFSPFLIVILRVFASSSSSSFACVKKTPRFRKCEFFPAAAAALDRQTDRHSNIYEVQTAFLSFFVSTRFREGVTFSVCV